MTTATQEALHFLEEREGAVLYWQAPALGVNWPTLVEDGVILFDEDCYVHPAAVKLENPHGSSWRMPVLQDYVVETVDRANPNDEVYVEVFGPNGGHYSAVFLGGGGFDVNYGSGHRPHQYEVPLIKRAAEEAMK